MSKLVIGVLALCALPAWSISNPNALLKDAVVRLYNIAQAKLAETGEPYSADPVYPYWNFFPSPLGALFDKHPALHWSAPCFAHNSAVMQMSVDGTQLVINIKSSGSTSDGCSDSYGLASAAFLKDIMIHSAPVSPVVNKEVVIDVTPDVTAAELWDLANKGLRVFRYPAKPSVVYSNLIATLSMFIPDITGKSPEVLTQMARDMLLKYTHQNVLDPIDPNQCKYPDPSEVHSGDFIGLIGLDGMGAMMSWAMGSTTSHTAVAMWIDGELNVCESTGDGVQCNSYEFFLNRYNKCQVILAPLSAESRARFNETAALEYFKTVDGLAYGYHTLLWTWIDTETDNFPCIAPDFQGTCMTSEWSEVFMALVDRSDSNIGYLLWNTGLAKRLGVADTLRTAELFQIAGQQGYKRWSQVAILPELDEWKYNTTGRDGEPRVGQDMTCCVFVCQMWKAGGVFDPALVNDFNCAELTNWDDYVLTILDPKYTQIHGNYTMVLNNYNSKDPYAHMGDHCPGLPPDYVKDPKC